MTNSTEGLGIQKSKRLVLPRQILIGSILLAVVAWLFGYFANNTNVLPSVPDVIPNATRVEQRGEIFIGLDPQGNVLGYAATGQGQGYAGPIEMLVGVDVNGEITGVKIIVQRETPGFFRLIVENEFVAQFVGLQYRDP